MSKQLPESVQSIINKECEFFKQNTSITDLNNLPDTTTIPIENPTHWFQIPNVICVFVDMINSTGLSAKHHPKSTASTYRLFTETAVRIFHNFESPYIDVRGDGVFALFNATQVHRALVAAVTFKTFSAQTFVPQVQNKTEIEVGAHIGIDQGTVLVRKIGLKVNAERTDRQNEVWAGKPVNMAAKLSSISSDGELLVSKRYYDNLKHEYATKSCGCAQNEDQSRIQSSEKSDLWLPVNLNGNQKFDFTEAYCLKSIWCIEHGKDYAQSLLDADS